MVERRPGLLFPALPLLVAAGYIVLLIARSPELISWLNRDGDFASAFVLTEAISHGHTGAVVMGTQGAWVSLWYGLLTQGLPFHRILWEISPALLAAVAAAIVGGTVARLSSRANGLIAFALIVCASPVTLANFTAPWEHNSTTLGVALLDAFLVWLYGARRKPAVICAWGGLLSVIIGTFLASDALLWTEGIAPFLLAPLLIGLRTRDRRGLAPVLGVAAGSVALSALTSAVMRWLDFRTTTPPLHLDVDHVLIHGEWLLHGLLRMGNGLGLTPQDPLRSLLTGAAAVVTVAALVTTALLAARCVAKPGASHDRARSLHLTFWFTALACAAGSYMLTAEVPSDRYFLVAVPAVAACVPLLGRLDLSRRVVAIGATVFVLASTVALACGDSRYANPQPLTTRQVGLIEALVHDQHLGTGYAGYWEAAPLTWLSAGNLRVYPISNVLGPVRPTDIAHVSSWYHPVAAGPSFVLLVPSDSTVTVSRGLPKPRREYRIGRLTLLAYPYDIARYLRTPSV